MGFSLFYNLYKANQSPSPPTQTEKDGGSPRSDEGVEVAVVGQQTMRRGEQRMDAAGACDQ